MSDGIIIGISQTSVIFPDGTNISIDKLMNNEVARQDLKSRIRSAISKSFAFQLEGAIN